MIVLWALPTHGYRPLKPALIGTASTLLPIWLLMVYAFGPHSLSVGEGWLATRKRRKVRWVRTDQLARVSARSTWGMTSWLTLEDRDGRSLRVDLDDLRANPEVWKVFLRSFRHSRGSGMAPLNHVTANLLRLK
jgi:hypothetical protein